MRNLSLPRALLGTLPALLALACAAPAAHGAAFTVTETGDGTDAVPGDGACDSHAITAGLQCTLRAAIEEANALGGADTIAFNLVGPPSIAPATALPAVTGQVTIDGTTQPGTAAGSPGVELNGSAATGMGLVFQGNAANSVVRGLAINRFSSNGITIAASGIQVKGNHIGTNMAGTVALGNLASGIQVSGAGAVIGGPSGADRNVISGNGGNGISSNNAGGGSIKGNYIGTDKDGTAALGNTGFGVGLFNGTANTAVGGSGAGEGNVISGNGSAGIDIRANSFSNPIRGNLIGTDRTGTADLGNALGITVWASVNVVIGGSATGEGNVISGNGGSFLTSAGIRWDGAYGDVQGNRIGTNAAGTAAVANSGPGVAIGDSGYPRIGGAGAGEGNLISGNATHGVVAGASDASLRGNRIGTAAVGASPVGNSGDGVRISGSKNLVGGTEPGSANTVAFNGGAGVAVTSGTGHSIRGNSIYSNGGLAVDLGTEGVTANDPAPDADTGANALQNFPEVEGATAGATTHVTGRLTSAADTTYRIEFFSVPACDSSGNGEARTFLGAKDVTTGADGNGSFVASVGATAAGERVTATATDPSGNTSELSPCRTAGDPSASVGDVDVAESAGKATFTVTLSAASASAVDVDYTTEDGTAKAGTDYTATSGTLTFAPGESSKTVEVPLASDASDEPDEGFQLRLTRGRGASIADAAGAAVVRDDDGPPAASVADVEAGEGSPTAAFTVSLSAPSAFPAEVGYATADGSAKAGSDYTATSGTLTFAPGESSKTVAVPVAGDSLGEPDETFELRLTAGPGASIADGVGRALLRDDDRGGGPGAAPDTRITSAPRALTRLRMPSFAFQAVGDAPGFTCRVDGGAWLACRSPFRAPRLRDGAHLFEVRANGDSTPAASRFRVDASKPRLALKGLPKRGCVRRGTLRIGVRDASKVKLSTTLDRKKPRRTGKKSMRMPLRLRPGRHKLTIVVTDAAGNRLKRTLKLTACG